MAIPLTLVPSAVFQYDDENRDTAGPRWTAWVRDFELYNAASNITNVAQKKTVFLLTVGKSAQGVYYAGALQADDYDAVKTALAAHLRHKLTQT